MTYRKIKDLISELTLEEKAGLCSGANTWYTKGVERLGIPEMCLSDGPHGLRKPERKPVGFGAAVPATCFPTASALACSWDRDVVNKTGAAIAREARGEGVGILLGPGLNMKRSPLCGRNFEYYSEDPCLAGELGSSFVDGVQGMGVGVSCKHFAVNSQETRRHSSSANVDERTLREIYLSAFERVVKKAKPATIMESYNRINGKSASESKWLLDGILRGEWGYKGMVMSDWNAVNDRVTGLEAGLELEMPCSYGYRDAQIAEAVKSGKLDEAVLDRAVERILRTVFKYTGKTYKKADLDENRALAGRTEADCMVLLKNDGPVLPFEKGKPLAIIGEFCQKPRFQGGGSSHINCRPIDNIEDTMRVANAGGETVYAQGYTLDGTGDADAMLQEALDAAMRCGRAVIFAGLPDSAEYEGGDRKHMRMSAEQNRLISAVCAAVPQTAVVLLAGAPVEMPWLNDCNALLHAYLGGEGVAAASAMVLFGDVNPSGHLAETLPLRLEDTPCYLNFPGDRDECYYGERIFIGYRWYEKMKLPVAFPFGYGLSYTEFEISDAKLDTQRRAVSVTVSNTGKRTGKTVVQLYIGQNNPTVQRAVKELKGFEKVELKPGEEKTVEFLISERDLSYYDTRTHAWRAPTGSYTAYCGFSSADTPVRLDFDHTEEHVPHCALTRTTALMDIVEDPAYAPAAKDLLLGIFGDKIKQEIEEYGFTMKAPTFRRFAYMTLCMMVEYQRGALTEARLTELMEDANRRLENA